MKSPLLMLRTKQYSLSQKSLWQGKDKNIVVVSFTIAFTLSVHTKQTRARTSNAHDQTMAAFGSSFKSISTFSGIFWYTGLGDMVFKLGSAESA